MTKNRINADGILFDELSEGSNDDFAYPLTSPSTANTLNTDGNTHITDMTSAPTFYEQLQDDIRALRSKVDQQLNDMVDTSTRDMKQLSSQLQTMKEQKESNYPTIVTTKSKRRTKSPGALRRQASPKFRGKPQMVTSSRITPKVTAPKLVAAPRTTATLKATAPSVVTSQSSASSCIREAVSHDITEPATNLTKHVDRRRRQRALFQSASSSSREVSSSDSTSSSISSSAMLNPIPTSSSMYSTKALASASWAHKMQRSLSDNPNEHLHQIDEDEDEEDASFLGQSQQNTPRAQDAPQEKSTIMEETVNEDGYASTIIVANASPTRRAAAYEKYRTMDQATLHPWRQRKQRATMAAHMNAYQWNGDDSEDSGIVNTNEQDKDGDSEERRYHQKIDLIKILSSDDVSSNFDPFSTPVAERQYKSSVNTWGNARRKEPSAARFFPVSTDRSKFHATEPNETKQAMTAIPVVAATDVSSVTSPADSAAQLSGALSGAIVATHNRSYFDPMSELRYQQERRTVFDRALQPRNRDAPTSDYFQSYRQNRPDAPPDPEPVQRRPALPHTVPTDETDELSVPPTDENVSETHPAPENVSNTHPFSKKIVDEGVVPATHSSSSKKIVDGDVVIKKYDSEKDKTTVVEDKSLVVRKNNGGGVVRLQEVCDKTIRDPYGDFGVFTGLLLKGYPHGQGSMSYADGRVYIGEWKGGRWHGQGKIIFSNGDTYVGQYQMDKRHGIGRYEWKDGRVYDGDFFDDAREGNGTYSFPDGSFYTGSFHKGLRHGQGCYKFSDSSIYNGEFKDGKYDGVGECIWADGRCYRGEWKEGQAHGYGVEVRADGSVRHDGEWRNDKPVRQKSEKRKEKSKKKTIEAERAAHDYHDDNRESLSTSVDYSRSPSRTAITIHPVDDAEHMTKDKTRKSEKGRREKERRKSSIRRTLIRD